MQKPHAESSDTKKLNGMYLSENNSVSGWKNQCFTPIMWLLLMFSKTPRGTLRVKKEWPVLFCLKSKMCISAPKSALVFQPCIDAQMAARGISRSPRSAVMGLDFSPRCCSKYLFLCFNASSPFPSLKRESVLEVRLEPDLWPLQPRSAFCCPAWAEMQSPEPGASVPKAVPRQCRGTPGVRRRGGCSRGGTVGSSRVLDLVL